ncbi:MAG: primosomal protein N' [Gammaproteobacteria bacterium]|jgi:primosomal protein N' (replication factor Y)|nr:primosomal protein N' [Gammaproteobacteria bacterium]|tara:strand:+ start:795 stop:2990 length:2196 start_codon:yes stop_codon:yes gene_type:complete
MPASQPTSHLLEIAIPAPLRKIFQYLPTEGCETLEPGCRIRVPFGKQKLIGIFLGFSKTPATAEGKLRHIIEVIDQKPVLPDRLLQLCNWASEYYHHPIGDVLNNALPVSLRKGAPALNPALELTITSEGKVADQADTGRAPRQWALLQLLQHRLTLDKDDLRNLGIKSPVITALIKKNLATWQTRELEAEPSVDLVRSYNEINPSEQQQEAIKLIDGPGTYLLHGITGSGKTEVYLRAIEEVLRKNQQALVLVPEIGLTPQTLSRFTKRFSVPIETIHSGLTNKERLTAWQNATEGKARVVIGTRSAVFTPLPNPGLLIVDEEHDASFKQQEGFRYSARDLAVMRGQLEKIPVVLGSATPALESLHNCKLGKYQLINLPERTAGAKREAYQLLNLRHKELQSGLSPELIVQIREELGRGNQILVFINRRGFAPVLFCQECQWIAKCDRCDARLTFHLERRNLMCHHCGVQLPILNSCSECQSRNLIPLGTGTQRVEETLSSIYPTYPIYRIDRDSTRTKGSLENLVNKVQSGQPAILVGTQMLAKGHHFPGVTLVAMLDIDAGFFSSDYKAMERTGQLILQVGGRAGRETRQGKVLLQTQFADQPILQQLIREGYSAFAKTILAERKLNALPPYTFQCLFRAESTHRNAAMAFLEDVSKELPSTPSVEMLGPIPPNMEKRAGRYRAQLLFSSHSRKLLHRVVKKNVAVAQTSKLSNRVRWSLDIDPVDLV